MNLQESEEISTNIQKCPKHQEIWVNFLSSCRISLKAPDFMEFQDLSGMVMSIITMKMMTMVLILATMMIMLNPGALNLRGEQCYQREDLRSWWSLTS